MSTPHILAETGEIAKTVLLPGDPKRATIIASLFLDHPECVTDARGMVGFTGEYKGNPVSVMTTGMGMPSMGIIAHELLYYYEAKTLIRVGTCASLRRNIGTGEIIIAQGASTDSNFAHQYELPGTFAALADYELLERAVNSARAHGYKYNVGNVLSTDVFYSDIKHEWERWQRMGVIGSEMETYALYCEAARASANALGIFTVSDNLAADKHVTTRERQKNIKAMVEVALDTAFGIETETKKEELVEVDDIAIELED